MTPTSNPDCDLIRIPLYKMFKPGALARLPAIICAVLCSSPALQAQQPDTTAYRLDELVVKSTTPIVTTSSDGTLSISRKTLAEMPTILGVADPLRIIELMPEVAVRGEVSPGISVRGMDYSHNYMSINGGHLINPYHMLGLFSIYDPSHFGKYRFRAAPYRGESPNILGSVMDAVPGDACEFGGTAAVGLLSASASIGVPLGNGGADRLRVSARRSYIDKVFPDILKFGHAQLLYHFSDVSLSYIHDFAGGRKLSVDFFYSADRMTMNDSYYDADGVFRWSNMMGNALLQTGKMTQRLTWSRFKNGFDLRESTFYASLPSSVAEVEYYSDYKILPGLSAGADIMLRRIMPQTNRNHNEAPSSAKSAEASVFADFSHSLSDAVVLVAGVRGVIYGRKGYTRFYPLPKLSLRWKASEWVDVTVFGGREMQFTHLVKESDTGLPVNFWISADSRFKPQSAWVCEAGARWIVPHSGLSLKIDAYYRRLCNMAEFDGSILNTVGSSYDPLKDTYTGNGRSYGLELSASYAKDSFRAQASYTLGRSELKIPEIAEGWFPASYDRPHSFNAMAAYVLKERFHFSTSLAYAQGTPFTEAAYGYMVGENLICQYFPHNSSRLPDYLRLDFSFGWDISVGKRLSQRLDVSFYNLTGHDNVILKYYHYKPEEGIVSKSASFDAIIPGISYTLTF